MMNSKVFRPTLIAAAVVGTLTAGYLHFSPDAPAPALAQESAKAPEPAAAPAAQISGARAILPDFASIVVANGPAVVNISVSGTTKVVEESGPQMDPNDPFSEFFRRFQPQVPPQGEAPSHGLGSGFIVRGDGVVMTNAHVVDGASEVIVKLTDKREFKAKVVGIDKPTDTAVLKIEAQGLPTVKLGDPSKIGVGEWVLAIGSPFGFENSVTAGIVSAKSRSLPDEGYVPFIQTDVAVNPGNSGGPLFNLQGEVVGINSQIYSRTGGYQGLSFAIPIDVALNVEQQLLNNGRVSRGRLGISIQELNQSLADSFGLEKPIGALVGSVTAGSPAATAGIQAGDIIVKLNGKTIETSSELPPQVAAIKPGTEVTLEVLRGGKSQELTAKVGETEEAQLASNESPDAPKGRLGVAVRPLSPNDPRQSDVAGGLVVERSSGAAARAGIQPGDVLLAVNGQALKDPAQLKEIVTKADKHVALLVQRGNNRMFVPVELG
jgi:serine protease Do